MDIILDANKCYTYACYLMWADIPVKKYETKISNCSFIPV